MNVRSILPLALATTTFALAAQTPAPRPLVQRIGAALDAVPAIDNHTHLLEPSPFRPELQATAPVLLRSSNPIFVSVLKERFGVTWAASRGVDMDTEALAARKVLMERLGGEAAYWKEHLALTRTAVALVNQEWPEGTNGTTLRWVPFATTLLLPLPAESLASRDPMTRADLGRSRDALRKLLRQAGLSREPATLDAYLAFVDAQLDRWKAQGAVAVKLYDAYQRTLVFADVPRARAAALYAKGRRTALDRPDYLALQDHLARHIFLACGKKGLPVHIHTSHGGGPFLRLQEADVRNLESVLCDPRYFGTNFVLVHGGAPQHEAAAYLSANKSHVWIDLSAMPFLYARTEMVRALRIYLLFSPERTLFSTDSPGAPLVPAGAEVMHIALSRYLRECLAEALAGLVEDGVWDESRALDVGRSVLQGNARRLYGFP